MMGRGSGGGGGGGGGKGGGGGIQAFAKSRGWTLRNYGNDPNQPWKYRITKGRDSYGANRASAIRSFIRRAGMLE